MIYLAWILSLVCVSLATYHYRKLYDNVQIVQKALAIKLQRDEATKPKSILIDPDNIVQIAQIEAEELRKKLNPDA